MSRSRAQSAVALALAFGLVVASCASPSPPSSTSEAPPDPRAVAAAITEEGLLARLEALATASGTVAAFRAVGSAGYDRAATLVEAELRAAGWTVAADTVAAPAFIDEGGSSLQVGDRTFEGAELLPLIFAPGGAVEGPVVAVDWDPAPTSTGRGCAVTHYGDLPANAIVVVRSGDCLRRDQVLAAQQAGAAAFIAVYPMAPGGVAYRPTLIDPGSLEIPAAGVSRAAADALVAAATEGATARIVTRSRTTSAATRSVVAELPGSEPGRVVMLGAHLDSVLDGPGINDDGSGVAALLEIARALGGTRPRTAIRLAFWSGEELGLHGSYRYVAALPDEERRAIVAYLNVDMIASPNGFAGVYDEAAAPSGSKALRALVEAGVERAGGTSVGVDLGGGSDHRAFGEAGIATGGVYAGAADPVAPDQAATFGATAGLPADACYHQPCDDVANANLPLARLLTAALADVTVRLAANPELVTR
jgi:Zn-dependent M28 family amino/carboxypeptidase